MTDGLFLETFYSKTHKLIFKSNSRNTDWIVDSFTQVKSAEHMTKFNIKKTTGKEGKNSCLLTPMYRDVITKFTRTDRLRPILIAMEPPL